MDKEKVTFDKSGDWHVGSAVSEMDVHHERGGAPAPKATPKAAAPKTTARSNAKVGAQGAAPKKFDLSKVRGASKKTAPKAPAKPAADPIAAKKMASTPEKKTTPVEETPKVEEPVATPTPVQEPPKAETPSSPAEEIVEGTTTPVHFDPNYPPVHVPGGDPPIPAYTPEDVPEQSEEKPVPQPKFNLNQLGLANKLTAEEATPTASQASKMSLGAEESKPAEQASAPIPEVKPAVEQEEPETEATAPDFIFHDLADFCATTGLEEGALTKFCKAVMKASMTRTGIFSSKEYPDLRAYSCVSMHGRGVPAGTRCLITVGWDVHVTSCYLNDRSAISDGSAHLTCTGICAYVQGTPVALSLERKRSAIAL